MIWLYMIICLYMRQVDSPAGFEEQAATTELLREREQHGKKLCLEAKHFFSQSYNVKDLKCAGSRVTLEEEYSLGCAETPDPQKLRADRDNELMEFER